MPEDSIALRYGDIGSLTVLVCVSGAGEIKKTRIGGMRDGRQERSVYLTIFELSGQSSLWDRGRDEFDRKIHEHGERV